MLSKQICRKRGAFPVYFVTKDNIDEFVRKHGLHPGVDYVLEEKYNQFFVHYKNERHTIWGVFPNRYYIDTNNGWLALPKEAFVEEYEFVAE